MLMVQRDLRRSRRIRRTWYELIKAFRDETDEGIIPNTSFNLAEELLVETPTDAVRSFAFGGFKALYLQGLLMKP